MLTTGTASGLLDQRIRRETVPESAPCSDYRPVKLCLSLMTAFFFMGTHALGQSRPELNGFLGPPTPETCFWTDRAFKTVAERGPATAQGLILWSHGQEGNSKPSWHFGAPPVVRLFADRGWDVLMVQRNERCEGSWVTKGKDYVTNLAVEVVRAKKAGYRRVIVAGQSLGAATALGASAQRKDIDGVIAFALSHGRGSCRDPKTFRAEMVPFHEKQIKAGIDQSNAPRILISMAKDDHCVGMTFTPVVAEAFGKKTVAYMHFDESTQQSGHGAAVTQAFASTYGQCVYEFFAAATVPNGKKICAP